MAVKSPSVKLAVLVDDDPGQTLTLAAFLGETGFDVQTFASAEAALSGMNPSAPPDLIVTDLHMPGLDGWHFCRLLRSADFCAFNSVPIIVVSANFGGLEPAQIATDLGATTFVPLPISGDHFISIVNDVVAGHLLEHPLRVLIVEDSAALAATLKRAYERAGWQAFVASGVKAAIQPFDEGDIDVALIDYQLPDGTGDSLLNHFRQRRPQCICIMMTANANPELAVTWMKRGAAAYIRKPFDFAYLIDVCNRARRERSLLQAKALLEDRTKALSRSEQSYRLLFQQMLEAFASHEIICNADGRPVDYRFLAVNPAFEELTGLNAADIIGKTVLEVLPETESFWIETYGKVALTGQPIHFEHASAAIRKTLEVRAFQPVPGQCACVFSDITERKRMEEVLRTSLRQAQAATDAKSQFLANMSHEIRTPMNGILGMAQLLTGTDLSDIQRTYVEMLKQSGKRMMVVINDILDISRIESGHLKLESKCLNVSKLVECLLAPLRLQAQMKGLSFEIASDPKIPCGLYGDETRIGQVLTNLVGNAVKFTDEGSVYVHSECVMVTEKYVMVRFLVSDTGIGIPADKQSDLFEPFMQVDPSHTRRYGGVGLGLAIARQLAQLMNGSLALKSELGKGTTVEFSLALAKVESDGIKPQEKKPAAEEPHPKVAGGHVLIVEDDPVSAYLAQEILCDLGVTVTVAPNGLDAILAVQQQKAAFDLVLMDVQMPVMNGIQATQKIREQFPDLPIVAITAHAMSGDQERCLEAGMNDYVSKPFSTDELERVLAKWQNKIRRASASGTNAHTPR